MHLEYFKKVILFDLNTTKFKLKEILTTHIKDVCI